jgi:hypothetical protein
MGKDDDQKKEEKENGVINTGIQTLDQFITILAKKHKCPLKCSAPEIYTSMIIIPVRMYPSHWDRHSTRHWGHERG